MTKRTIAFLLVALLCFGTLAGCGAKNAPIAATDNGVEAERKDSWLCDEKQTITITSYDAVNSTYLPPSNDLWFWQELEAYTNVHVEWNISGISGYDDVVSTRLSAGVDLTDIIVTQSPRVTRNAGDSGVLIDMSPYWDSCFMNTKAYFEKQNVDILSIVQSDNGAIYGLPNTVNPTEGHITFCYNTDWLEALGAKVPTTLDEFTDLLYAMKAAGDLNGNGANDEIVLTSSGPAMLSSVLGNAFGLEQYEDWDAFNADANGKVYPEYTTDNMRACLSYMNKLYEDRLLDPEICYMSMDSMGEKIANDRVGVFVFYSGFAIGYGCMTTKGLMDPLAECYTLGLPLASEWNNNEGYFVRRTVGYGNSGACITSECENPELVCKWLDILYADPYIMWIRCYGKEGETYEYDANGDVQLIVDEQGAWNPDYLGIGQLTLPFIQTSQELLVDKLPYDWYLEQYEQLRSCKWISASCPKVSIYTEDESDLRDMVNTETLNYWYEWRDKFITGIADIDTEWDSFVTTINGVGMTQLTEAWQMVYDRLK